MQVVAVLRMHAANIQSIPLGFVILGGKNKEQVTLDPRSGLEVWEASLPQHLTRNNASTVWNRKNRIAADLRKRKRKKKKEQGAIALPPSYIEMNKSIRALQIRHLAIHALDYVYEIETLPLSHK